MRNLKMFLAGIALAGIGGCMSAEMVSSPNSGSAYAPVNEGARSGVVKYLNDGAAYVRDQRREDAYKQMYTACNGHYKILAESSNPEGGAAFTSGSTSYWAQSNYWYIQFGCI
jgi:hypothetical protein